MSNLYIKLKLCLVVAVLLLQACIGFQANAQEQSDQISRMEEQLFLRTYGNEPVASRVDRLETTIFGTTKRGEPHDVRLKVLSQFFQPPKEEVKTLAPPRKPLYKPSPMNNHSANVISQAPIQKDAEYPVVSTIEQKVFNRVFDDQALEFRLVQLENKVLGQPQQGTLQERTDQLRLMVLGNTGNSGHGSLQNQNTNSPVMIGGSSQIQPAFNLEDMLQGLTLLEKKFLKKTYNGEPMESRLGRLETKMFNSTAPEMSNDDRFYRLVSVMNAKNYDGSDYAGQNNPSYGVGGVGVPSSRGSAFGTFGSMLLMILMSLI